LAQDDVVQPALRRLRQIRQALASYIRRDPVFATTLDPYLPAPDAPPIARRMAEAAARFGVGPMAAVAGAVAEQVGWGLLETRAEIVIENGGDIFVKTRRPLTFSLYAGEHSPFSRRLRFEVLQYPHPDESIGVCTSSGTVGHSFSRGRADAVCVVAGDAYLADAAATAYCNQLGQKEDIDRVLQEVTADERGVEGLIIAMEDRLGLWGRVQIV
jgi:ApbE superfamily uncharacterized protein (UPF0280 family)